MTMIERRTFLASGAAALGALAAPGRALGAPTRETLDTRFGAARRVILAVSDGMSTGTLSLADQHLLLTQGRRSPWVGLIESGDAAMSLVSTGSADSMVTDSAAASSAWSIGEKVNNGAICFTPDGRAPAPVLLRARERGIRGGLVTTTRVTHATPAAFIANAPDRNRERAIADQIAARAPEVVLGGGADSFSDQSRDAFPGRVVTDPALLNTAPTDTPVLGLFHASHLPYVLDRDQGDADLRTMTRDALRRLDASGDPFILQVEGGRVDHAAHANDAASLLREQLEFEATLADLIDDTRSRDDTLLIATTDHGNANPGITIYGPEGRAGLETLGRARKSFEWIWTQIQERDPDLASTATVREIVEHATTIAISEDDARSLSPRRVERADLFAYANSVAGRLGSVLANHNAVAFTSVNHTADHAILSALGVGKELFAPVMDIEAIAGVLAHAAGIERVGTVRRAP